MNELEFIRSQVSTERRHMGAVRTAATNVLAQEGAAASESAQVEFLLACASYLVFIVQRFAAQDRAHCRLLRPRLPDNASTDRQTLDELEQVLDACDAEIAVLRGAMQGGEMGESGDNVQLARSAQSAQDSISPQGLIAALRAYLSFHANVLGSRRHALRHLFDAHYSIADWRATSSVNADSILEERARYARVQELLPEGIELGPSGDDLPLLATNPGR